MRERGFTVMELVVIIGIIGILAAIAVPRFAAVATFRAQAHFDELSAALRYAQRAAVANGGCRVQVVITASDWDVFAESGTCGAGTFSSNLIGLDGALTGSHPTGVTVTAATLTFDGLGRADTSATITVAGGDFSDSFSVVAATGFVDLP